ncbi:MAG TPA: acyl-ACP thioesterase domain-containing protein [Ktedonobacterales bacterium]
MSESRHRRDAVPAGAYREGLRVRSYEVGQAGRTQPATLLRYLEQLATNASAALGFGHRWYEEHGDAWVVREMSLLLGEPPGIDDEVELATWLSDFRRVQAYREYAIWHRHTGKRIARACGRWAFINRHTGQVTRVPDEIVAACPTYPVAMPPRRQLEADAPRMLAPATYGVIARRYEADSNQHINNCVYLDWLAEALGASLPAPGAMVRWPRSYHIEYIRPTWPGDQMRITTRHQWQESRRLIAWQEIVTERDGMVAVRARSEHLLAQRA